MENREAWTHFEHGADIGVRGCGPTLAEAFAQTARALTAVVTEPDQVAAKEAVQLSCAAPDNELLLADWLNALVYEMATRHMLFSRFDVTIEDHHLHALAWGEPVDVVRHSPVVEVKGATYTALAVTQDAQGRWCAQCVVDV